MKKIIKKKRLHQGLVRESLDQVGNTIEFCRIAKLLIRIEPAQQPKQFI